MKTGIHPKYYDNAKVQCACGNTFTTGSTKKELRVDVCYNCHPLYTGEKRYIDTLGQVGKFEKKQKIAQIHKERVANKRSKKKKGKIQQTKSLKELLMEV